MQSADMLAFPQGIGSTGNKIPEFFPLRFMTEQSLRSAVAEINNFIGLENSVDKVGKTQNEQNLPLPNSPNVTDAVSNIDEFKNEDLAISIAASTTASFTREDFEGNKTEAEVLDAMLDGFEGEDQDVLAKRRVNQGRFRKSLLRYWGSCCCVSEVADTRLLVASHIVPWSKATKTEKGDPANGLLLSVQWDALFDRGIISFQDDGTAILKKLDSTLLIQLGIDETKAAIPTEMLTPRHREYLKRHRELYEFE